MNIRMAEKNGVTEIAISGRLDTNTALEFDRQTAPCLENGCKTDICINCEALEYISSAGLRSFISLLKATRAQGRALLLANLPDSIRSIFDMTGFTSIFKIQ